MAIMMRTKIGGLILFAATVGLLLPAPARSESDPKAVEVGKQMWSALGGDSGWNGARYLRFDFVVTRDGNPITSRAHYWDRFTGKYRVDGVDKGGAPYSIYFNVHSREGEAFVNGKKVVDAAEQKKWLDLAYKAFINDTYWLLAPYKLFDPGVNLEYIGEDKGPAGEPCDVIRLSFDNVGLTPKDLYWMYVDRATHLLTEWKYVLNGANEAPAAAVWSGWKDIGGIEIADQRTFVGKPVAIRFEKLAVSREPDDRALTPPAP
jgi:hypothetical protein